MIKIRKSVFETNSSSMHAITVPAPNKYTEKQLLKELERFKVSDYKYIINITCNDDNIDKHSFTLREYVRHDSLNDKLIYMLGTVIEHYNQYLRTFSSNFGYTKNPIKRFLFKIFKFFEYHIWAIVWKKPNREILNKFEERIKLYEKYFVEDIKEILADEKYEVELHLNYLVNKKYNTINYFTLKDIDWFSLGCYDNTEVFIKLFDSFIATNNWLLNPYSVILAGSDEMSDREIRIQTEQAQKINETSFKKYFKTLSDYQIEEEKNRDGKYYDDYHIYTDIIYPVGG